MGLSSSEDRIAGPDPPAAQETAAASQPARPAEPAGTTPDASAPRAL